MPEFPDIDISGWTGVASEVRGRGPDVKCFVEWDAASLARMPPAYRQHCEEQGLYAGMVCLQAEQLDAAPR